jgi:hypothetical protein
LRGDDGKDGDHPDMFAKLPDKPDLTADDSLLVA